MLGPGDVGLRACYRGRGFAGHPIGDAAQERDVELAEVEPANLVRGRALGIVSRSAWTKRVGSRSGWPSMIRILRTLVIVRSRLQAPESGGVKKGSRHPRGGGSGAWVGLHSRTTRLPEHAACGNTEAKRSA
jgi:hypothetical protein